MSDMEHNKGKLIPHFKANEMQEDHLEDWLDENYEDFTLIGDTVYKVEWKIKRGELYDFAYVDKNEDGSINFNTYHYNGGGHWTEVVEEALNEK
jgi:hypothetical protein